MPRLDRNPNPLDDPLCAVNLGLVELKAVGINADFFRLGQDAESQAEFLAWGKVLGKFPVQQELSGGFFNLIGRVF